MKKSIFRSNKKFFHLSLDYQTQPLLAHLDWLFLQKKVSELSRQFEVEVQALVMMDTHVHLLGASFGPSENFFCDDLQRAIMYSHKGENLSEPILNYSQYLNTYKYIYRNPVEAGLSLRAEEYLYSSLGALLGRAPLNCEIHDQLGLIQNPLQILKWLNYNIDYKVSQMRLMRESRAQI
jgi:REP element-mobilizing transposase RayT